jgi:hypothetical protein
MKWKVTIPAEEIAREITAAFSDQELITKIFKQIREFTCKSIFALSVYQWLQSAYWP